MTTRQGRLQVGGVRAVQWAGLRSALTEIGETVLEPALTGSDAQRAWAVGELEPAIDRAYEEALQVLTRTLFDSIRREDPMP